MGNIGQAQGEGRNISNALLIFAGLLLVALAFGFNGWMVGNQATYAASNTPTGPAMARLEDKDMRSFQRVYQLLMKEYVTEPDSAALIEGAIQGMIEALNDPRSHYYNAEQMSVQSDQSQGAYTGIGSSVQSSSGRIVLVYVYPNSPAEKAGLINGDMLVSIDGIDAIGMPLDEAVARVRGARGTTVTLVIERAGVDDPFEVVVTRDVVETITVQGTMLEEGIGMIQISSFTNTTGPQFGRELQKLLEEGMQGLILDLRNNGGGTLDGLMDVANMLVPEGTVFTWIFRDGVPLDEVSTLQRRDFEVVVLMNSFSASASEVLAGALQDTGAGKLVGVRSFGKGSAQHTYPLDNGGGVSLTASKWLTPNGKHIEGLGLEPDVKVHDPYDPLSVEKNVAIKPGQIELLQAKLQALGYEAPFEAQIGESTAAALRAFQVDNQLYVSGSLSDDTIRVLNIQCYERIPHESDPQLETGVAELKTMIAAAD